ncbi:MAG TPA: amidase [Casimicrobiaceae bacterium]|nr:amidase [Casimicrobiaceae bacterium]
MPRLNRLSATQAARMLAAREITAEALLDDCLARIAERDAQVRAWMVVDASRARERARALDRAAVSGPLHGLPIAVKDVFDTVDMVTTYGSPIYANHRPASDAAAVALARAAGGVIVGKTVTTEFATYHPGPTRNPHNTAHTPGGSSSGSAAAVADYMVPLGFGTQTAGSIVRPAAFCGVVGYKPTFGTVSRVGVKMISDTLDTIGGLARTVRDVALFVGALSERHELFIDDTRNDAPRIGFCHTYEWAQAQPEAVAAFEAARRDLERGGARVRDITLPKDFAGLADSQIAIMTHEVANSLSYERLNHRDQLSGDMTKMIDAGLGVSKRQYDHARALVHGCRAQLDEIFRDVDVIVAPSAHGEAPEGTATGNPLFQRMWTMLRTPCVHLPTARGPHGLPVGITVIGRMDGDAALLRAADWMHDNLGGPQVTAIA